MYVSTAGCRPMHATTILQLAGMCTHTKALQVPPAHSGFNGGRRACPPLPISTRSDPPMCRTAARGRGPELHPLLPRRRRPAGPAGRSAASPPSACPELTAAMWRCRSCRLAVPATTNGWASGCWGDASSLMSLPPLSRPCRRRPLRCRPSCRRRRLWHRRPP